MSDFWGSRGHECESSPTWWGCLACGCWTCHTPKRRIPALLKIGWQQWPLRLLAASCVAEDCILPTLTLPLTFVYLLQWFQQSVHHPLANYKRVCIQDTCCCRQLYENSLLCWYHVCIYMPLTTNLYDSRQPVTIKLSINGFRWTHSRTIVADHSTIWLLFIVAWSRTTPGRASPYPHFILLNSRTWTTIVYSLSIYIDLASSLTLETRYSMTMSQFPLQLHWGTSS